jgi:sorting nexin-4
MKVEAVTSFDLILLCLCFVLQDCILDHMEICVTEAEKRETGALNIRDFYTVYLVETKLVDLVY